MTIVGLHDFVKVSISASLRSFMLIMCIDTPESTTNSLSSGFNVDARQAPIFRRREECCSIGAPLILTHFCPASHACFAGTLLLPPCLFAWTILKFWSIGAAVRRFTWINVTERGILVSNFGMTCKNLCELHTLDRLRHVSALPENRLWRCHVPQRFCHYSFWTISSAVCQPDDVRMSTSPQTTTTHVFAEQAFKKMPSFAKWVIASSFEVILARPSRHCTTPTLTPGLRVLDGFRSLCCTKEFWDGFDGELFPRLSISWRKLQLSPFRALPVGFPLPTISKNAFVHAVSFPDSWPWRVFS